MKKAFSLVLIVAMLVLSSACSAPPSTAPTSEYHLTAGQLTEVEGKTFSEKVVVYADAAATAENRSEINFTGCVFEKGLEIVGDRSAWVRISEDCTLKDGHITVKEATAGSMKAGKFDDDFLKLSLNSPGLTVDTTALLTTISTQDVTINGTKYALADFPDCNTFLVASYYFEGEPDVYTEGWME